MFQQTFFPEGWWIWDNPTGSARCFPGAWFKSLRARVTLFSMDGGVVPAVNDGRTRPSRQSGPTLYTAKCYPGLNQAFPGDRVSTEASVVACSNLLPDLRKCRGTDYITSTREEPKIRLDSLTDAGGRTSVGQAFSLTELDCLAGQPDLRGILSG
jgi:hypothetical protein